MMNIATERLSTSTPIQVEKASCHTKFAKLIIRPDPQDRIAGQYELELFVDYDRWWKELNFKEKDENGNKVEIVFLSLNKHDLRVRHAPNKGSSLKLFDKNLKINHLAKDLSLNINASIKILKPLRWPSKSGQEVGEIGGLEGFLQYGSIQIGHFNSTFDSDWQWLFKADHDKNIELLLGASKIQLKLPHEESTESLTIKQKLYDFQGTIQKAGHSEYLWKLDSCPFENLCSPDQILKNYQKNIASIAQQINEGKSIEVVRQANPDAGVYYLVSKDNDPATFLKPGLEIKVFQEGLSQSSGDTFSWSPKALRVTGEKGRQQFQLLDYDEIALLLDSDQSTFPDTEFECEVKWSSSERVVNLDYNLPQEAENVLQTKRPLFLTKASNSAAVHKKTLWGLVQVENSNEEFSWMRYLLNEYGGSRTLKPSSKSLSKPTEDLSGSLLEFYDFKREFNEESEFLPWRLKLDLLDQPTKGIQNRLEMSFFEKEKSLQLKIHKPSILAESPPMLFYAKERDQLNVEPLKDMYSMQPYPFWEKDLRSCSLIFYNEPDPAKQALALGAVQLTLDKRNQPIFKGVEKQLTLYQTTHMAVIDRASATSNNLPISVEAGVVAYSRQFSEGNRPVITLIKEEENGIKRVDSSSFYSPNAGIDYKDCWLDITLIVEEEEYHFLATIEEVEGTTFILKEIKVNQLDNFGSNQASFDVGDFKICLPKIVSPRDPGHGYFPQPLKQFHIQATPSTTVLIEADIFEKREGHFSTESLMPWVEREFKASRDKDSDKPRLYHKNLVLEHADFELAREYADLNEAKSSYEASWAFIQATRDRYCVAAELYEDSPTLLNWLPGASFKNAAEEKLEPKLSYTQDDQKEKRQFPEVSIKWQKDNEPLEALSQKLGIHIADSNWLEYEVRPEIAPGTAPSLELKKVMGKYSPQGFKRTINSYTPLLFDSKQYLDNLGIVRAEKHIKTELPWKIETHTAYEQKKNSIEEKVYYSVSVNKHTLIDEEFDQEGPQYGQAQSVTQLLVTLDQFKVRASDGKALPLTEQSSSAPQYSNQPFNVGVFSFYSKISSFPNSPFEKVNHWPRYKGIPFLVTEIEKISIDPTNKQPTEMTFFGVFANPEQLLKEEVQEEVPDDILHALTYGKVVKFSLNLVGRTLKIVEGSLNWIFSVSSQLDLALSANQIPGRLSGIEARIVHNDNPNVQIFLDSPQCTGLALGKLWPLESENLKLNSHCLFKKQSTSSNEGPNTYLQVQYGFCSNHLHKKWVKSPHETATYNKKLNAIEVQDPILGLEAVFIELLKPVKTKPLWIQEIRKRKGGGLLFILEKDLDLPEGQETHIQLLSYAIDQFEKKYTIAPEPVPFLYQGKALNAEKNRIELVDLDQINLDLLDFNRAVLERDGHSERGYLIRKCTVEEGVEGKRVFLEVDSSWSFPTSGDHFEVSIYEQEFLSIETSMIPLLFNLDLQLTFRTNPKGKRLEAKISYLSRLRLYLQRKDAKQNWVRAARFVPELIQSHYYCLRMESLNQQRNQGSLILWIENKTESKENMQELPYALEGLLIENIDSENPFIQLYMAGKQKALTPFFTQGLHLWSIGQEVKKHTLSTLVLIGENFILSFEDQNFSKLYDLKHIPPNEIKKGQKKKSQFKASAFLQLFRSPENRDCALPRGRIEDLECEVDEENIDQFQAPIVVTFEKEADGKISLQVQPSYYAKQTINYLHVLSNSSKPDIQYSDDYQINLREVSLEMEEEPYLSLKCNKDTAGQFSLRSILKKYIPLNFCLEPNAFSNLSKQDSKNLQLVHRHLFGRLLRIQIENDLYDQGYLLSKVGDQMDIVGQCLLAPLGTDDKERLSLMRDHVFLKLNTSTSYISQTEQVLVLNRPTAVSKDKLPFFTLTQHTLELDPEQPRRFYNPEGIRKKIIDQGANGIVLHRIVHKDNTVSYRYIPSPFHDVDGEKHVSDRLVKEMRVEFKRFSLLAETASSTPRSLDIRFKHPLALQRFSLLEDQKCYEVFDERKEYDEREQSFDPGCCSIARVTSYRYKGPMQEEFYKQNSVKDKQPSVYLYETPAYINSEPQWYIPPCGQQESQKHQGEQLTQPSAFFLPYQLEFKYGSDKPGAVFHHQLRNIVYHQRESLIPQKVNCAVGALNDLALREAQQIKVQDCLSAAIEALVFTANKQNDSKVQAYHIQANWEDVFGRIPLNDLFTSFDSSSIEAIEKDKESLFAFKLKKDKENPSFPMKFIWQHNYDVFALEDLDGALPAYFEERRKFRWWSNLYLSSRIESLVPSENYTFSIPDPSPEQENQEVSISFKPYLAFLKFEEFSIDTELFKIQVKTQGDLSWLNSLKDHLRIALPGLQMKKSSEYDGLPPAIESIEYSKESKSCVFAIKGAIELFNEGVAEGQALSIVLPMSPLDQNNPLFGSVSESFGIYLWQLNLKAIPLSELIQFQILWLGSGKRKIEIERGGEKFYEEFEQIAFFKLYTVDKIVKMLMPALSSPKIAGVLHLAYQADSAKSYKRTLFFGNGAPIEKAEAKVDKLAEDDYQFKLFAQDKEQVEVSLPKAESFNKTDFYLIKYMNRGQVVYDEWHKIFKTEEL